MQKMLVSLVVVLLLATTTQAQQNNTFAPLISENCVAVAQLDFSKVEIDSLKKHLAELGEQAVAELGFDARSKKSTLRELNVELEKLDKLVRPTYDTLTKELGIREIALIADWTLMVNTNIVVVAIPWKDKNALQSATLKKLLNMEAEGSDDLVAVPGFLLLPLSEGRTDSETVKAWFENLKPSENTKIYDALKECGDAELKIAATIPESLKLLVQGKLGANFPPHVAGPFLFLSQKVDWAASAFSLTPPDGDTVTLLAIKAQTEADATQLRAMLEGLIDMGMRIWQVQMQQEQRNAVVKMPPLFFEFIQGHLRTLLPKVDGDRLLFQVKGVGAQNGQVVVAAGGVTTALLLPAAQAAREASRRMQCSNHIKHLVLAMHNYHDTMQTLPPLYTVDKDGKPLHSWRVHLLPFLEQQALYSEIKLDEPWDSEHNKQFHDVVIPFFQCPSNPNAKPGANCCYSAIAGQGLVANKKPNPRGGEHTMAWIMDGTSNTIAIVEVKQPFCWMDPTADVTLEELEKGINTPGGRAGSQHPGGMNVGCFDGFVRFITNNIDTKILRALATPAGGETASPL